MLCFHSYDHFYVTYLKYLYMYLNLDQTVNSCYPGGGETGVNVKVNCHVLQGTH